MSGGDAILGVCFDLDGTLVDSERLQWEAYRRVLADHGVDIGLDEYRRHFIAVAGGAEYACRRYGLPFDAATLRARKGAVYHELIAAGVPPMRGARACLERLRDGWRLAVVTNSTRAEATTILDRLGFTPLLHAVVAREDYAGSKPAPDAYLAAAATLGCAPQACVAVEDTPRGLAAARAAGMRVVAVPGELTADQNFDGAWRRLSSLDALDPALLDVAGARA
jgi:HAD superfamily hydrolase (TIGR01509 family)